MPVDQTFILIVTLKSNNETLFNNIKIKNANCGPWLFAVEPQHLSYVSQYKPSVFNDN